MKTVGLLLFDNVELLDFAGPYEVFAVAARIISPRPFEIVTVAAEAEPIRTRDTLRVLPHATFAGAPHIDLLVIPGGPGARELLTDTRHLNWIKTAAQSAELVMSVCTGALLLGRVGLLDDLNVTTHHQFFDILQDIAPKARIDRTRRVIDTGKVITSGGISAGIDMALYIIGRLLGEAETAKVAAQMEYSLVTNPSGDSQQQ